VQKFNRELKVKSMSYGFVFDDLWIEPGSKEKKTSDTLSRMTSEILKNKKRQSIESEEFLDFQSSDKKLALLNLVCILAI
jgi:hypothetical protein